VETLQSKTQCVAHFLNTYQLSQDDWQLKNWQFFFATGSLVRLLLPATAAKTFNPPQD